MSANSNKTKVMLIITYRKETELESSHIEVVLYLLGECKQPSQKVREIVSCCAEQLLLLGSYYDIIMTI